MHEAEHEIQLWTGRPEEFRRVTEDWLVRNNITFHTELLMRPHNDWRKSTVVKGEWLDNILKESDPHEIIALDDREDVAHMWIEKGVWLLLVK